MNSRRLLVPGVLAILVIALAGCGDAVTPAGGAGGSVGAAGSGGAVDPASAVKATKLDPSATVPYAVTGRVRDAAGKPVTGALVSATSLDGATSVPELAVLTDGQGTYRWPSLQPGRYELKVKAPAGTAAGNVTVPAAGTATLDLTLAP